MKILHTSDWHVGKTMRGKSRADEHVEVLAEIASIAEREKVDMVLVAGDIFDTAAPTPEAERIVYRALLDLANTGATVVVISGNHDNERRLEAVRPLLEKGEIITRAQLVKPEDGGVIEGAVASGEPYRLVLIPFLSQRYIVRAEELMNLDSTEHSKTYEERLRQIIGLLCKDFDDKAVNLVVAHLTITGALMGGGERSAQTIFDYYVSANAFPTSAHYVALGHLHRAQRINGPCPIWYSGAPLQIDFGETENESAVLIVEATPETPAEVKEIRLTPKRRLRTISATLDELEAMDINENGDYLRIILNEQPKIGLANDVRQRFPNAVEVRIVPPETDSDDQPAPPSHLDKSPHELFARYLAERDATDEAVLKKFDQLLDEVYHAPDPA